MLDKKITGAQIHQFNNIQQKSVPRSVFDRSFPVLTAHGTDYIYPIMNDELLPGDHVRIKTNLFTRLNPTVRPVMDNLYRDTHAFFIPMRIIWDNWEKFQGQQLNPTDSVDYTIPIYDRTLVPLSTTGFAISSLQDYMEIPPNVVADSTTIINSYFERAYNQVWNDWYKDENLDTAVTVDTGNGPDNPANYVLLKRRKRKDYRTSALPWPQKGDAVTIELGGFAPVIGDGKAMGLWDGTSISGMGASAGGLLERSGNDGLTLPAANTGAAQLSGAVGLTTDSTKSGMVADLSASNPITINSLRDLITLQQMLELDARGGTRYTESLYSRWGVIAQDARLQRSELIGEESSPITVFAVPQTSAPSGSNSLGQLGAYSTGAHSGSFEYTAQEHGVLLILTNVRADLRYSQYLPRKRTRQERTDFYEPIFAILANSQLETMKSSFKAQLQTPQPLVTKNLGANTATKMLQLLPL